MHELRTRAVGDLASLRRFYPPAYELWLIVKNMTNPFPAPGCRAVYNLFKKH